MEVVKVVFLSVLIGTMVFGKAGCVLSHTGEELNGSNSQENNKVDVLRTALISPVGTVGWGQCPQRTCLCKSFGDNHQRKTHGGLSYAVAANETWPFYPLYEASKGVSFATYAPHASQV